MNKNLVYFICLSMLILYSSCSYKYKTYRNVNFFKYQNELGNESRGFVWKNQKIYLDLKYCFLRDKLYYLVGSKKTKIPIDTDFNDFEVYFNKNGTMSIGVTGYIVEVVDFDSKNLPINYTRGGLAAPPHGYASEILRSISFNENGSVKDTVLTEGW